MNVIELQRTHGNFSGYNTRDFPLDCEGMEALQMNETLLAVLGNIGGEKYKFSEPTTTKGTYVFLATQKEPTGELLYLEKKTGTGTTHVHIESLPVHITAQENEYNEAYTKRWLAWGGGNEQFLWSSFKEIKTNLYLQEKVVELENKIVDPTPVGTIVMWSGNSIPPAMATKWRFCNGTELSKTEYPELYAVIGNTYGGGSTHFFIPNLRGKFPVGAASGDADFNWNKTAGARTVTLQTNQLPDFSMSLPTRIGGDDNNHSDTEGLAHGDLGSTHTLFHFNFPVKYSRNKETGQYGQAIKILPPYLTLGFIIKVK